MGEDTTMQLAEYSEIPLDDLVRSFIGAEGIRGRIANSPEYADYVKWLDGIPAYLETLPVGDLIGAMYDLVRVIEVLDFKLMKHGINE